MASAKDKGANGLINLVDQSGAEQAGIDFAPAFTEKPLYFPLLTQPTHSRNEVQFLFTKNLDLIGNRAKPPQVAFERESARQNNNWRKALPKNFRTRVKSRRAAHHDAQVVFRQTVPETGLPIFGRARPKIYRDQIHGPCACHHRIRFSAQLEQKLLVAFAAKGNELAVGGRQLAV